jgi:peptidoglycan/LPS O-acetylase OafA/YrhL
MLLVVLPYICLSFGLGRLEYHRFTGNADLSYGLFLYGFPVQQTLSHFFAPQLGPWLLFWLTTAIAGVFAYFSWHLIEKRALSWKPQASARTRREPRLALTDELPDPRGR